MALAYALFKLTVFPRSEPLRPMVLHILEDCLIVAAKVSNKCKSILLCAMQLSLAPLIEKSAIILLPCPKANLLDIVAPGSSQELLKGPSAQPHSTSSQVSARRRLPNSKPSEDSVKPRVKSHLLSASCCKIHCDQARLELLVGNVCFVDLTCKRGPIFQN